MSLVTIRILKADFKRFSNFRRFTSSAVPVLPLSTSSESSTSSNEMNSYKMNYKSKRRTKRFGSVDPAAPPSVPSLPVITNTNTNNTNNNNFSNEQRENIRIDTNNILYTIYGNILAKEEGLLVSLKEEVQVQEEVPINYPIDASLLKIIENSTKCWYFDERTDRKIPLILSVHGPSRANTWEIVKHLAHQVGKSQLAMIPFSLFYELLRASSKPNNEIKRFGAGRGMSEYARFSKASQSSTDTSLSREVASTTSRCAIQVFEYLFSCLESSLGDPEAIEPERFTLFVDGFEEYLLGRKGGEGILRDLQAWAGLYESTGRRIILGARNAELQSSSKKELDQNSEDGRPGPEDSEDGINDSSSSSSSAPTLPIQMIADLFLKSGLKAPEGKKMISGGLNSVLIDGQMLRCFLTGPKNDRRSGLKYAQLISQDRQKDLFDINLSFINSIATSRWNFPLKLNTQSRHDFPSNYPEIYEEISQSGRGILTKRRLTRDEIGEIVLYALGCDSGKKFSNDILTEALDHQINLRHDPTKFSSDDLQNLFGDRQIKMSSLTKYEKRFVNCISTSTTQTKFADVSLPPKIISTLRSMTTLPLSHPELFTRGILKQSLTGVLLFGPPGTGKTMLARAVAEESGATFISVNMSNIFDMWVGEGEKNVKGMFDLARRLSPSIIFIDEIDALLEKRSSISGRSSRLEIVNEFMAQWDGLTSNSNSAVIVMGATNRPFVLDDAVLRRLPRRLLIDLPDPENRLQILRTLLKDNLCETELLDELPDIVEKLKFYSGSDLKNVAITAALKSAMRLSNETRTGNRHDSELVVLKSDLEEAIKEVPASLSDQMDSLIELRKWNHIYGETKDATSHKKFGFA